MATTPADILLVLAAAAIVVAQWFILRSTARGMRHAGAQADTHVDADAGSAQRQRTSRAALEWLYAIAPAIALALLLAFTWRAMHPDAVKVEGVAPSAGVES